MKAEQAVAPSLDEFKRACLTDFSFLVAMHGFEHVSPPPERYPNPFQVHFEKKGWRLIVHGLSYGFSLDLEVRAPDGRCGSFGHLIPPGKAMLIRQDYVRGQLGEIACAARCLREYGDDFLRGDWRRFDEIAEAQRQLGVAQRESWQKEEIAVRLKFALEDADLAFRSEDYERVVAALSPFEATLSPAQRKKLEIAKRRKSG
jgi:hypothetical protein